MKALVLLLLSQTPVAPAQLQPMPAAAQPPKLTWEQQKQQLERSGARTGAPEPARTHEAPPAPTPVPLLKSVDEEGVVRRFDAASSARGRPRIAVFFNRTLSDEVREWKEPQTVAVVETEREQVDAQGKVVRQNKHHTETPSRLETNPVTERRTAADEVDAWGLESGFVSTLLTGHARLVDRATVLRLAALQSGKQGDARARIGVKELEMKALVDHADYFVELLVRQHEGPLGVELQARVNEVKTGIMVASVTTASWVFNEPPPRGKPTRKAFPTATGFEYREVPAPAPPPLRYPTRQEVIRRLSVDVMDQLASAWAR